MQRFRSVIEDLILLVKSVDLENHLKRFEWKHVEVEKGRFHSSLKVYDGDEMVEFESVSSLTQGKTEEEIENLKSHLEECMARAYLLKTCIIRSDVQNQKEGQD